MKYLIYGTITHNFSVEVSAESKEEAGTLAIGYAEDGWVTLGEPVEDAEISEVKKLDK